MGRPGVAKKSEAHLVLEIHMRELGLYFHEEVKFDETRQWRFDYLVTNWPNTAIAIEIDGGTGYFKNPRGQTVRGIGRHTSPDGYARDLEKLNTATMKGYRVLRFTTQQVNCGEAKAFLEKWLTRKEG